MFNPAPPAYTHSSQFASNIQSPAAICRARSPPHPRPNTLPQHDHSPPIGPSSEVTLDPDTAALRKLATSLRLRSNTLPELTVDGLESDPAGVADRLGMNGLSVYTAFIEKDSLRCRVCGDQSSQLTLAILHQRVYHHFQH